MTLRYMQQMKDFQEATNELAARLDVFNDFFAGPKGEDEDGNSDKQGGEKEAITLDNCFLSGPEEQEQLKVLFQDFAELRQDSILFSENVGEKLMFHGLVVQFCEQFSLASGRCYHAAGLHLKYPESAPLLHELKASVAGIRSLSSYCVERIYPQPVTSMLIAFDQLLSDELATFGIDVCNSEYIENLKSSSEHFQPLRALLDEFAALPAIQSCQIMVVTSLLSDLYDVREGYFNLIDYFNLYKIQPSANFIDFFKASTYLIAYLTRGQVHVHLGEGGWEKVTM